MVKAAALMLAGLFFALPVLAAPPERVVSMNLCTDQLALLLGGEGQVVSVSDLAQDPRISSMTEAAMALPVNHGFAEEIFLLKPDLVLAGSYTNRASVALLQQLGIRVEVFEPANALEDVHAEIVRMGEVLGQQPKARAMAAQFDTDLAALRSGAGTAPRAALYYANGYTTGDKTLAGQILVAAGFRNVAAELGLSDGGNLPLEQLVMAKPDMVITGEKYPGASRSEELMDHPALLALMADMPGLGLADRDWVCGSPFVLRAVAELRAARKELGQ